MQGESVTLDGRPRVAVRTRDLWAAMGVTTDFGLWLDRVIARHGLVEGTDFEHCAARGGRASRRDAVAAVEAEARVADAKGQGHLLHDLELPPATGEEDDAVDEAGPE